MGGELRRPRVVLRDQRADHPQEPTADPGRSFPLRNDTVEALSRGMWGVVNEGGTGASAHETGLDIAGKTGTAQVVSVELMKSARKKEFRNNGWFVGYSPSSGKPDIVVAVLVIRGEHSTVAVPVAREIIKAYDAKKHPQQPPTYQTQLQAALILDDDRTKLAENCPPRGSQPVPNITASSLRLRPGRAMANRGPSKSDEAADRGASMRRHVPANERSPESRTARLAAHAILRQSAAPLDGHLRPEATTP